MENLLKSYVQKISISSKKVKNLFFYFLQYVFAGVSILNWVYPFGMVFYVLGGEFLNKLLLKIIIIAGLYGKISNTEIIEYIVLLYVYDRVKNLVNSISKKAILLAGISLVLDTGMLYFEQKIYTYTIVLIVLKSIVIFSLVCIADRFFKVAVNKHKKASINNEEIVSLLFLITVMFAGFSNINFSGLNLLYIMGYIFVLLMSHSGGMLHGALAGCVVSAAIVISGNDFNEYHLLIPIIGMVTGIFKTPGKIIMSLAFSVISVFVYILNSTFIIETIDFAKNLVIAVLIFNVLPIEISKRLEKMFRINGTTQVDKEMSKVKAEIAIKLENYSEAFLQLASIYEQVAIDKKAINKSESEKIFNFLIQNVCKNCVSFDKCWNASFYTTSKNLYEMMDEMEKGANVQNSELKENAASWCLNAEVLVNNITELFDVYKGNLYLANKIQKNKKLLAGQLYEIADMTQNISKEIQVGKKAIYDIEERIASLLEKYKLEVRDILVIINDGKYKIELLLDEDASKVEGIVKEVELILNRKLKVQNHFTEENITKIVIVEKEEYNVFVGVAQNLKEDNFVCGDSYKYIDMDDENYVIVLSDGMGTGICAERESRLTIELIEKFIKLGFSKEFIIRAVNSLLIMNAKDELYATLDLLIIDRNTGKTDIIKIGAFPTFIKKQGIVEIITSESAPIGLIDELNVDIIERNVSDGDIILSMTDGILNSNRNLDEIKHYIAEILENLYNNSPQEIAEYIMYRIKERYNDEVDDDLTIVVAKIGRN
ncbi:MAG: hypothetical protein A2Y24_02310 [Clostridiales bacterium GWE2_32_10]|nr:MAG: hypothetical protein A2Y24_02310 [Clostridiales bacterium GWE2_32_10]